MDLLICLLDGKWNFVIASIPLITVFFLKKYCKITGVKIFTILILQLMLNTYFWIKLADINIVIYQIFPYLLSFVWVWCDSHIEKKKNK